jgi:hypothetical protein
LIVRKLTTWVELLFIAEKFDPMCAAINGMIVIVAYRPNREGKLELWTSSEIGFPGCAPNILRKIASYLPTIRNQSGKVRDEHNITTIHVQTCRYVHFRATPV